MKKFNFLLSSILLILFFVIPFQNVLAVDVPLQPGDTGGGSIGPLPKITSYSLLSTSTITETINAVTVDLTGNELILNFNNQVGVAQISIVDQSGFIVYQDAVDTYSTSDLVIPVDTWESGKYTIKITYGTTSLSGSFRLY
ncbi:MAG: DUF3244 domain-containing protein [Paludibacter sp.]